MCGIIGFTGNEPAKDIIIGGLERLEYRGYDSAGLALLSNDQIQVRKRTGKVEELRKLCEAEKMPATCGIGHTRWATHGGVTDVNAHPHRVGKVVLIHNGIIENYRQIVTEYGLADQLVSETDSEVVAALLNKFYEGDPVKAIKKTVKVLSGAFALCIMFQDIPDTIYAIRNVSPMVATSCERGSVIASDLTALIEFSKEYFVVPEYHILTLKKDGIDIQDLKGNKVTPQMLTVNWDITSAQKGGYPFFMLKEIYEQPDAIRNTIAPRINQELPDFTEDGIDDAIFKDCKRISIVACGTAMHAGMVGKHLIEKKLRIPVHVDCASEFRYKDPIIDEETLTIVLSQSGETIDTLEALKLAKNRGSKVLSIVNVKGSTIARESDYVLYTHAGPEIAVASTKAYTVQVAAMYLIACRIGLVKGLITEHDAKRFMTKLTNASNIVEETLKCADDIKRVADHIKFATDTFYIGRGLDYTMSLEAALKLKEISYVHAEAYAAGELKHGTISLIEDGILVVGVLTQNDLFEKTLSNMVEVKSRGAYLMGLTTYGNYSVEDTADFSVYVPKTEEYFSASLAIVPLQLMGYYVSVAKGLDVDKPRNLAKSVTVE